MYSIDNDPLTMIHLLILKYNFLKLIYIIIIII